MKIAPTVPRTVKAGKTAPFHAPPGNILFSIDASRSANGGAYFGRTTPSSSQCHDPLLEYFPRMSCDFTGSRCVSAPLLSASSGKTNSANSAKSETVVRSLKLLDLENLSLSADDVATAAIEKKQTDRRRNISSAMDVRQHGSPRIHGASSCDPPTRRKRLDRERAYLLMKYHERPCLRTESFLKEELGETVNDMSRECCDVLGPKACHECDRLNRRSNSALRNEANFPSIHISAANFSTMTLVNQLHPELSPRDVLERLAHGQISRQTVRRLNSIEATRTLNTQDNDPPKRSVSAFNVSDGQGYFTNFLDLREQMLSRRGKQPGGGSRAVRFNVESRSRSSSAEVEIVPKKPSERENPANYFGPPMMSRDEIKRQQSQPRFYAGTKGKYELPEVPSLEEIAKIATGARQKRHLQLEARNRADTADSTVSMSSVTSCDDEDGRVRSHTREEISPQHDMFRTVSGLDNLLVYSRSHSSSPI